MPGEPQSPRGHRESSSIFASIAYRLHTEMSERGVPGGKPPVGVCAPEQMPVDEPRDLALGLS
jgi:hypothetical protein